MQGIMVAILVSGLVIEAAREKRHTGIVHNLLLETDYFIHNFSKSLRYTTQSVVISPYSLHSALTQTSKYAGGRTANEMRVALGMKNFSWNRISYIYNDLNIMIRNEYYTSGILFMDPAFLAVCGYDYQSIHLSSVREPYPAQIHAPVRLNGSCINPDAVDSYLLSKTEDTIEIQLPPDRLTQGSILLINAMMIRAEWQDMFDREKTYKHGFVALDPRITGKIMVDMMTDIRTVGWKRDDVLKVDVVEVPLKGRELGLYILLPHEDRGLLDVENKLLESGRTTITLSGRLTPTSVRLGIPKFRLHTQLNLRENLRGLGMDRAFTPKIADFSPISLTDKLYLSDVIHVTAIVLNEEGISVSAATPLVSSSQTSERVSPARSFIADHAFHFFIRHNYLGRVLISGSYTGQ